MGPDFVKKDMTAEQIQRFFDPQGTVVVEARRQDVNGQCTKKGGDCRGKEVRDSRYNDMKASMYLLGNAFRTDQQKPPDRLRKLTANNNSGLLWIITCFVLAHIVTTVLSLMIIFGVFHYHIQPRLRLPKPFSNKWMNSKNVCASTNPR
jgi:hypothetical protein